MRDIDTAVLAAIAGLNFSVLDGDMAPDTSGQVVTYPTPYAIYYSSLGDERSPRLSGRTSTTSMGFQLTYVGVNRTQAKWAGELLRGALAGTRLTVASRRTWLVTLDDSQRIRRDDEAKRPDGTPLFYGTDLYRVAATKPS